MRAETADMTPAWPKPKDRSSLKVPLAAALWAGIIALILAVRALEGTASGPLRAALLAAALLLTLLWVLVASPLPGLLAGPLVREAARRSGAGDHAGAAEVWDQCARRVLGRLRAVALFSAATERYQAGEPDAAIASFGALDRSRAREADRYAQAAAAMLSFLLALRGELELAAGWAVQARRRPVPRDLPRVPLADLADGIVAARRGDAAAGARLAEQVWPALEALGEPARRAPYLLAAAFLMVKGGRPLPAGTPAGEAAGCAWMGGSWTELGEFLGGL